MSKKDQEFSFVMRYARRNKTLKRMGLTYPQYLKSDIWMKIKAKAAKKASAGVEFWKKCNNCGKGNMSLQLHHMHYKHMDKVILSGIVPLCGPCHTLLHEIQFSKRIGMKKAKKMAKNRVQKILSLEK